MRPVLLPVALFLGGCAATYGNTVDDAYITFRYAHNLASGNGLVFNLGERIEGFSNPLWLLLLAGADAVGLNIVDTAKVLGIVCGVATLVITWRIATSHFRLAAPFALAAVACLATNTGFVYFSAAGLETLFYTVQVAAIVLLVLEQRFTTAAVVCAVLAWTRPEGILFVAALGVGMSAAGVRWPAQVTRSAIPIAAYGALVALRWSYFGPIVPNTFDAKVGANAGLASFVTSHSQALLIYSADFARTGLLEGLFAFPCLLGVAMTATKRLIVVAACVVLVVLFAWLSAGDWMPFSRFFVPLVPLLFTCGYFALEWMYRRMPPQHRSALLVLAAAPVAWNIVATAYSIHALNANTDFNPAMHSRPHLEIGGYLRRVAAPSDRVVTNEIGAIGYRSNLALIDMQGLVDAKVPALLAAGDFDGYGKYILSRTPRFVLLNDRNVATDTSMPAPEQAVFDAMANSNRYVQYTVFSLNSWKHVLVFVPRDDVLLRSVPGSR